MTGRIVHETDGHARETTVLWDRAQPGDDVVGDLVAVPAAPSPAPAARIDGALDDLRAALDRLGEALDDRVEAEWARLKMDTWQGLEELERTLDRVPERARAALADLDARFDDRSAPTGRASEPAPATGERSAPPAP